MVSNGVFSMRQVINTYCFISTTFSVPELVEKAPGGEAEAAVRGLGPYDAETDDVTYHAYYQWVPFVLFAQVRPRSLFSLYFRRPIPSFGWLLLAFPGFY